MVRQAMASERDEVTYGDVERLCRRHLADRARIALAGPRLVRYERSDSQRCRTAHTWVSEHLLERIDFDRAFKRLGRRHQKVLVSWYGMEQWTQQDIADWLGVTPRTVRRWHREAINALRNELNA